MWKLLAAVLLTGSAALDRMSLRCTHENCKYVGYKSQLGYTYKVHGQSVRIIYENLSLTIDCNGAGVLDSPALPCADPALRVSNTELRYCPPPAINSFYDMFNALNVTLLYGDALPRGKLALYKLPPAPPLAAKHFIGLEQLVYLDIFAIKSARASPMAGFLAPLRNLHTLSMWNVELADGELSLVPPSLQVLALSTFRVERVPETIYASISLRELTIHSTKALDAVAVPSSLVVLKLDSPATTLRLDVTPALETLSVSHWTDRRPSPLTRCESLRELHLEAPAVISLPNGWLTNCSSLEKINIQYAHNLIALPRIFSGNALKHIIFSWGSLESLSKGLLDNVPNLRIMDLNNNHLRTIPSGTFAVARGVHTLDLHSNKLENDAMVALAPLEDLSELNLSHNKQFGDVCEAGGYSPIKNSVNLTKLFLDQTGVTRICRDWRLNMTLLEMLELSNTKVASLTLEDLQFRRAVNGEVWVAGAPVSVLEMSREDFIKAADATPSGAQVYLNGRFNKAALQCDCRMYWTRRTLTEYPQALENIDEFRCADGKLLREIPLRNMTCPRPEECKLAALPVECSCAIQPDADRNQSLVFVRCEGASLRRVPRPRLSNNSTDRLYELLLANNNITDLHADDLRNVKGLDLSNNSLTTVDEETAGTLGRIGGMLRLAGNPLDCGCSAVPLLSALHSRAPSDSDIGIATCSDGTALYSVSIVNCTQALPALPAWLVTMLAALFAFALICVSCVASRERRFFPNTMLHTPFWRSTPEEDDDRFYDAYITFSHEDEAIVHKLMERLEPAYRLCIHYRDWIPGLLIFDQIIESVRQSRRTIALVSRHFLASSWARVEFREAHSTAMADSRPRLIVVLLEEPDMLPLDVLLRRYINTNTYVRWGEPWFWDKLLKALPPPRLSKPSNRLHNASTITYPAIEPVTAYQAESTV